MLEPFFPAVTDRLGLILSIWGRGRRGHQSHQTSAVLNLLPTLSDGTHWTPLPSKPLSDRVRIRCGQFPACFGLTVDHAPSVYGEAAWNSISQTASGFAVTTTPKPSTTFPSRLHFPAGNAAQRPRHGERDAYPASGLSLEPRYPLGIWGPPGTSFPVVLWNPLYTCNAVRAW